MQPTQHEPNNITCIRNLRLYRITYESARITGPKLSSFSLVYQEATQRQEVTKRYISSLIKSRMEANRVSFRAAAG